MHMLNEMGIDYTVHEDEATALCPAHQERRPSWSLNLDSGLHNCFSCGYKGNILTLVRTVRGGGWDEALSWVRQERTRARVGGQEEWGEVLYTPLASDDSWKYTEAALVMFEPPPQHKLDERRLTAAACEEYGILWDPKKESWILPIREPYTNKLWGWQEKNDDLGIVRNRPRSVAKSRALFGFPAIEHGGRAIVVESPLDAARLSAAGVRGGVSSYGVQISDEQLFLIRNRSDAVVFAFDNDLAGLTVSENLRDRVRNSCRFLNYTVAPQAKDPGDMTDEQVAAAVDKAQMWCVMRFDLKEKCTVYWGRNGGRVAAL